MQIVMSRGRLSALRNELHLNSLCSMGATNWSESVAGGQLGNESGVTSDQFFMVTVSLDMLAFTVMFISPFKKEACGQSSMTSSTISQITLLSIQAE